MYFNLLEEFYWIFGAMSMIGASSEENRNVRETQVPCPAVMFPAHVQPQSHHKMALLSNATWRVLLAFRVYFLHLCPDPRLELLEPCRQWQDSESILILVKGVRVGRVGVTTLNPDGSQVICINYTKLQCACVYGVCMGRSMLVCAPIPGERAE